MNTINPFQYGGIVGPEAFCNRQQELQDLIRAAENAQRMFVYAERRLGKTSLVQRVMDSLDRKSFLPVYIDLWPTDGTSSFIAVTAKALAEATASRAEKILEASKDLFSRLQPSLTLDEAGNPSLQFDAGSRDKKILHWKRYWLHL